MTGFSISRNFRKMVLFPSWQTGDLLLLSPPSSGRLKAYCIRNSAVYFWVLAISWLRNIATQKLLNQFLIKSHNLGEGRISQNVRNVPDVTHFYEKVLCFPQFIKAGWYREHCVRMWQWLRSWRKKTQLHPKIKYSNGKKLMKGIPESFQTKADRNESRLYPEDRRKRLLWKNTNADIPGFFATCKRENAAV